MSGNERSNGTTDGVERIGSLGRAELVAQVRRLAEENRRLREAQARAHRGTYRRAAVGFVAVGALAAGGAALFPASRTVLFALAGIGLFTALLTYYLTPERVIAAPTGERVYEAYAATGDGVRVDLDLQDVAVYAPAGTERPGFANVRLFIPQRADYALPEPSELDATFVVTDDERERGVSFVPTGAALFAEYRAAGMDEGSESLADTTARIANALADGFELVEGATTELDVENRTLTVGLRRSTLGTVDRFDHPVGSFVATSLAERLETPVTLETTAPDGDADVDYRIVCRWDEDEVDTGRGREAASTGPASDAGSAEPAPGRR